MRKFLLAFTDHHRGEHAGIERRVSDFLHDIGNGTGVVEVTVGDDQGAHPVFVFLEVFGIRQNIIDSGGVRVFKLKSGINDNNVISDFNCGHVFSDFFYAAQRNDADGLTYRWDFYGERRFGVVMRSVERRTRVSHARRRSSSMIGAGFSTWSLKGL